MATPDVADPVVIPTRHAPRRGLGRLSLGHVIMIVAGLLAFFVNLTLLQARDETWTIAVAASDLSAGQTVSPDHFRLTTANADPELVSQLVTADQVAAADGSVATRRIEAGELILASDLRASAAPQGLRAMSIPVDPVHAAGGAISPGDRVDVIAIREPGARYVLVAAEVLAVAPQPSGALGSRRDYFITVAVDSEEALGLAAALGAGDVEVVRSTGSEPPSLLSYELSDPTTQQVSPDGS